MEEKDIMLSSDKKVRLTNRRIIIDTGERTEEIMVDDYIGYSINKQHTGNFRILAHLFGMLTVLLFLGLWHYNVPSLKKIDRLFSVNFFFNSWYAIPLFICSFFFIASVLYYVAGRRYFLELKGKYNSVSVQVKNPSENTMKKFLLTIESLQQKRNSGQQAPA